MKCGILLALAGLAVGNASGQVLSTWQGTVNDAWGVAGNWTPIGVPNNGGGTSYAVVIGSGSPFLNLSPTIDRIGIGVGASLTILNGSSLSVLTQMTPADPTGTFSNQGTVYLESTSTYTDLVVVGGAGSYLLHGNLAADPATIVMSNSPYNRVRGANGVERLHLQSMSLLRGAGQLGVGLLEIDTDGVVQAEGTHGLVIDPNNAGCRNRGVLKAEAGPLVLRAGVFTNLAGGSIQAVNGNTVTIDGATVIGGDLFSTPLNGSYIDTVNGSRLDGVRGGDIRIPNGHAMYITNGLTLCGQLHLASTNTYVNLVLEGDNTISGNCDLKRVSMSNSPYNRIYSASGAGRLTLANFATIRGAGQVGVNMMSIVVPVGHSIESEGSYGMTIDPNGDGVTNLGQLIAGAGSVLELFGGLFDQGVSGAALARADSVLILNGAVLRGGQTQSIGNGLVQTVNGSELDGVTNTGLIDVPNGHVLFLRNGVSNSSVLRLSSTNTYVSLVIRGDVPVTGAGTVLMSNSPYNRIYAENSVSRMTIGAGQTVRGAGALGVNSAAFTNNGLIESEGSHGLVLDPGAGGFDNNAVIRAGAGSPLTLTGGLFDNTGATIEVRDGGSCTISASVVTGGTLTTSGTGFFNLQDGSELNNTSNTGLVGIPNGHVGVLRGTLVNSNRLNLNSSSTYVTLLVRGDTSISGNGLVWMSNSPYNRIYAENSTDRVTIAAGQVVRGAGALGVNAAAFTNNGLIESEGTHGLVVDPNQGGFDNNTLMRALPGSPLVLAGGVFENVGATIEVQDGGSCTITGSVVSGGSLVSAGSGFFNLQDGSELHNVTNHAVVGVPNGRNGFLRGACVNQRLLNLNSTSTYVDLLIRADVTISGSGSVQLSNSPYNRVYAEDSVSRLTIGPGQTLRGAGQVGANAMALTNAGSIIADQPWGLVFDPSAGGFTNNGLLRAEAPNGGIEIRGGPFVTTGQVVVDAGRMIHRSADAWVQAAGQVVANGEIQVDSNVYQLDGGVLMGNGRVDSNTINSGGEVAPGVSPGTLTIEGTYVQQAGGALAIEIGGPAPGESDVLVVTGAASLDGELRVSLINGYMPTIGQEFAVLTASTRNGEFSSVNAPGFTVQYLPGSVRLTFAAPVCDPDVNCDGVPDQGDVACIILAVAGDMSCFCQADPDFNRDGVPDQGDVADLILSVAGAPCP